MSGNETESHYRIVNRSVPSPTLFGVQRAVPGLAPCHRRPAKPREPRRTLPEEVPRTVGGRDRPCVVRASAAQIHMSVGVGRTVNLSRHVVPFCARTHRSFSLEAEVSRTRLWYLWICPRFGELRHRRVGVLQLHANKRCSRKPWSSRACRSLRLGALVAAAAGKRTRG